MSLRVVVGVVAMACVSVCGVLGTIAGFEMVDRVNEKLPDGEKFEALGWNFVKGKMLFEKYKLFYPDGRLITRVRVLRAISVACLLVAVWAFKNSLY
jgi:hypothetical protein